MQRYDSEDLLGILGNKGSEPSGAIQKGLRGWGIILDLIKEKVQ
jgi:hypothetical protein